MMKRRAVREIDGARHDELARVCEGEFLRCTRFTPGLYGVAGAACRGSERFAPNCARMSEEEAVAARCVAEMFARDRASQGMGIEVLETGAGFARISFVVRDDMINGAGSCHGGYIFALADSAFAFACNSRGDASVALQCSISFSAPGRAGDRLTATARERSLGGRTGTYDVEVATGDGKVIALFRGTSYRVTRHA
jgi:acyl-CoA thioesterase